MKRTARTRLVDGHQGPDVRGRSSEQSSAFPAGGYYLRIASLIFLFCFAARADGPDISVQLDSTQAGPRKIEAQTEGRILADYRMAWADIAQGLNANDADTYAGFFVGNARQWLERTVTSQRQAGVSTRYFSQSHKLQVVFYAPEGDLIELHDIAECDRQVLARGKVVHEDHGVHRYVVLMTPGADRWVIRELAEVAQF
jgi:hypothetical protein